MPDYHKDALLSDCGLYRYRLTRSWGNGPRALFIMLNPSTADASIDDRTIGRCNSFAREAGCDGIEVVNLFGFRATKPSDLPLADDPVGPGNDECLFTSVRAASGPVIAAWGSNSFARPRAALVLAELAKFDLEIMCLRKTQSGAPYHPLYVKGGTQLIHFQKGLPS